MSARKRRPEYDDRDRLFNDSCDSCLRKRRCTFWESPEGAEAVCTVLVEQGVSSCETCLRTKATNGVCIFKCCFYTPKD